MQIVRNVGHVKRRKRLAKLAAFVGFLLLTGTFVLALNPQLILVAYLLLFVGFLVFNLGMQQVGKWSRNPRDDVILDKVLATFGDKYALLHYVPLGKRTVEHLLLHPGGGLVITTRWLPGKISVRGAKWRRRSIGLGRLFGLSGPQLGNPGHDTQQDLNAVTTYLTAANAANAVVEWSGAVVFLHPNLELETEEPEFPALIVAQLPEFVRQLPTDSSLRPVDRQRLLDALTIGDELVIEGRRRTRRPVKKRVA